MTVNDDEAREKAWREWVAKLNSDHRLDHIDTFWAAWNAHAALAVPAGKGETVDEHQRQKLRDDLAAGKVHVMGEWLAVEVDECTCGAGPNIGMSHEPGCGCEPIDRIENLLFPTAPVAPIAVQGEGDEPINERAPWRLHPQREIDAAIKNRCDRAVFTNRADVDYGFREGYDFAAKAVAAPAVQGVTADRVSDSTISAIWRVTLENEAKRIAGYTMNFGSANALYENVLRLIRRDADLITQSDWDTFHALFAPSVPKIPTPTREALTAWLREGGRWETIRAKDEYDAARALLASDLWEGGK